MLRIQHKYIERLRDDWRRRGLRWTPERERVVNELFSAQVHLDADQLVARLQRKGLRASKATVYRTLARLLQAGMIQEVFRCGGKARYELARSHHDHLLCTVCGKVTEFSDAGIERRQEAICKKYGFKALEHRMSVKGLCKTCRGKSVGRKKHIDRFT